MEFDLDKICYRQNYVTNVIVRIDLATIISDFNTLMPKEVGNVVKKWFPIFEPQDIIGAELQFNIGNPVINNNVIKQWTFSSRDRKNQCIVNSNCIVISYNEYNIFEEFKSTALDILNAIEEKYPEASAKRIGLRFVNVIPLLGDSDLIYDRIIQPLNENKDEKLMRAITTIEYNLNDDINVRYQYGYINKDYPANMVSDDFTIDVDAFTTGITYFDEIDKLIEAMHNEIQRVFEKSITEKLRDKMK